MRLEIEPRDILDVDGGILRGVNVFLSERNLRALLAKLQGNPPDSACTLVYMTKGGVMLAVTAEPDSVHYANPERDSPTPGKMHPETEAAMHDLGGEG